MKKIEFILLTALSLSCLWFLFTLASYASIVFQKDYKKEAIQQEMIRQQILEERYPIPQGEPLIPYGYSLED